MGQGYISGFEKEHHSFCIEERDKNYERLRRPTWFTGIFSRHLENDVQK